MKVQNWIFSVRVYLRHSSPGPLPIIERWAVVGPARASTVEAVLHLANAPEAVRAEIRANAIVRDFIDGRIDPGPASTGYYVQSDVKSDDQYERDGSSWLVCIGPVHEVLQ